MNTHTISLFSTLKLMCEKLEQLASSSSIQLNFPFDPSKRCTTTTTSLHNILFPTPSEADSKPSLLHTQNSKFTLFSAVVVCLSKIPNIYKVSVKIKHQKKTPPKNKDSFNAQERAKKTKQNL